MTVARPTAVRPITRVDVPLHRKWFFPVFFSWIEETDVTASKRVSKLSLCPLVVIAPETAKAQIIKIGSTALRFRNPE